MIGPAHDPCFPARLSRRCLSQLWQLLTCSHRDPSIFLISFASSSSSMGKRNYAPPNTHAEAVDEVLADLVVRRGSHPNTAIKVPDSDTGRAKMKREEKANDIQTIRGPLMFSLLDFSLVLSLVFGGCCSYVTSVLSHNSTSSISRNVWAYEYLLNIDSRIGT